MNKSFTFLLLALGLLFHACTKQTEVQPNENTPIPNFWKYTSDQSLVSNTISTLQAMGVSDSFEKYVSLFGKPLWDSSLTSLSPGEEIPSSIIIPIVHRYKQFTNAAILGAYVGDKFQYQLIYRYYMPKELIQTADDKNRWESLFLAFDKQLFDRGQSSGFHRQQVPGSGKGNANARYIEIATTYCSTTYVVDSEGVPISPSYTTCNTEYIYQWIDDAPLYTPPTPTDPGSGYVPVTYPPSGGGGGGANPTTPAPKDVINEVKDPCLKAVLQKLVAANLKTDVASILKKVFGLNDDINVTLKENPNLPADIDGVVSSESRSFFNPDFKIFTADLVIELNTPALAKATNEYIAAVILHEVIHAYIRYRNLVVQANGYPGAVINIDQHDVMASTYVEELKKALLEVYPNYSPAYAEAISWGGLQGTVVWNSKSAPWKADIIGKNKAEKGNVATPYARKGTSCN